MKHNLPSTSPYSIIRLTENTQTLLPHLTELYRQFAEHEGHTTPVSQFSDFITARLADETMLALLLTIDSRYVGYILAFDLSSHPLIPNWERSGYITNLFVMDAYQRRGYGQRLVHTVCDWLKDRGVTQVMLNVDVDNPNGARFWETQGFHPILTRMKRELSQAAP